MLSVWQLKIYLFLKYLYILSLIILYFVLFMYCKIFERQGKFSKLFFVFIWTNKFKNLIVERAKKKGYHRANKYACETSFATKSSLNLIYLFM